MVDHWGVAYICMYLYVHVCTCTYLLWLNIMDSVYTSLSLYISTYSIHPFVYLSVFRSFSPFFLNYVLFFPGWSRVHDLLGKPVAKPFKVSVQAWRRPQATFRSRRVIWK